MAQITSNAYDSMDRVTTVSDSAGAIVYGYDEDGRPVTVTDALGHTTTTLYDALGRATTIVNPTGGITTITYNAAGEETSLTDPDGNETQWAYDAGGRVTTMTLPNGSTVTYVYDSDGELTDTTDADGRRTTYSYNADGEETGETWVGASPAEKITYTYDSNNELTGAVDAYATLTFTYDSGGNLITSATSGPGTGQPSVTLTSGYDALHSLTSVTDNISGNVGVATYVYDASERLTTITTSHGGTAGPEIVTSYTANDQISAQSRTIGGSGTSVNTSYSYDASDRQTTITDYVSGGSALATYVYSYDNANRVTTMVDAEGTYTYTYDNGDELTSVYKGGTQVESYAYDANGDRTGTGYSTTVMNETLTSPGVITYTYDNAGNMTSANNGGTFTTYTYDYRNRLTEVKQGGTIVATYTYNALNQRIGVQEGGSQTWTVYNGKNPDAVPYADFNGSGALLTRYLSGAGMVNAAVADVLLARTSSGGATAWYLTDKLDSVRDIVSSAGSVLNHVVYDSFGNITTETNASNGDRFTYAGMEYDSTTAQFFDNARWYGAGVGHFTIQDPKGFGAGDPNLYRYTGNNATDATDPSGLDSVSGLAMPSWGDYWHFLTNPSEMDTDLQTTQACALGVAAGCLTLAGALLAVELVAMGAGGLEAASTVMVEEGVAAAAPAGTGMAAMGTAMGESATVMAGEGIAAMGSGEAAMAGTTAVMGESGAMATGVASAEAVAATTSEAVGAEVALGGEAAMAEGVAAAEAEAVTATSEVAGGAGADTIAAGHRITGYYPPNGGFEGVPDPSTLVRQGDLLNRFGYPGGYYLSPANVPAVMRSLPADTLAKPLYSYVVRQNFHVIGGRAAAWFSQPGGGMQYLTDVTVQQLVDWGYLEWIGTFGLL